LETYGLSIYIGLFVTALLAATLLPGSSEVVLVTLAAMKPDAALSLLAVASIGNVLGATINWSLGRWFLRFKDASWFPVQGKRLDSASRLIQRHGSWLLLFSWAPIVGDPITFAAGLLQVPFPKFLLLVSIGKIARYAALIGAFELLKQAL
jgi:membrane protein YqaA with SNARE-associated domain